MYTNPPFARRGVGRLVLALCESAAAAEGFTRLELMATMSGRPLYESYGFVALAPVALIGSGEVKVPALSMGKVISVPPPARALTAPAASAARPARRY